MRNKNMHMGSLVRENKSVYYLTYIYHYIRNTEFYSLTLHNCEIHKTNLIIIGKYFAERPNLKNVNVNLKSQSLW